MPGEQEQPKVYDENSIWTTLDGRQIKVKDLKTAHAVNIVKHLLKRGFVSAKHFRADAESMIVESLFFDFDDCDMGIDLRRYKETLSKCPSRMMDAILDELKRRGVDTSKLE